MPQYVEFKLPDVGEGLVEAEIVSWKVKAGDKVEVNTCLVEIETAKSLVELPCPHAGVIHQILVDEGVTVDVGTVIITIDVDPTGAPAAGGSNGSGARGHEDFVPALPGADADATTVEVADEDEPVEPGLIGGPAPGGRTSVLVGYGPRNTDSKRRARKGAPTAAPAPAVPVQAAPVAPTPVAPAPVAAPPVVAAPAGGRPKAKPPVRKLAKDLGIDLAQVTPTGQNGVVTRDDVLGFNSAPAPAPTAPAGFAFVPGQVETRIPIKGVRKMTAQAMVNSAFTAPHVTEFVTVDVTRSMDLVARLKQDREFKDVKVSPLLLVMKALLIAIKRNPEINASWDEAAQEIVVKSYVNLGIAAATPRGLMVPNIKNAERLSLRELAEALVSLTGTAREGKTQPADMSGGTISITNVGVFGVDNGTPILNPGEAAILCFGAVRKMPWVVDDEICVRQVTQLALSFDHRLVDGDLGSRFLADIAAILEHPEKALVWG